MSLSHHQSYEWSDYIGDIIMWLMQFSLQWHWHLLPKWVVNVNLHHLVQSKWKIGEADFKIVNELLTYAVTLDSLTLVYKEFVIMLTQLQKVLPQELKCLCNKTTKVLSEWTVLETVYVSLSHIYCIINKQIDSTEMYAYCTEIDLYSIQVCLSTSGIVIHCT